MKFLMLLALAMPIFLNAGPLQEVLKIEHRMDNGELGILVHDSIDAILNKATKKMAGKGYSFEADKIMTDWYSEYSSMFYSRKIGDFPGLSQWLTDTYNLIELTLGVQLCVTTHISDLKTFNHAIPVCFNPCKFPYTKSDFNDHFSGDGTYRGLSVAVTYWAVLIGCEVASGNAACGILATVCEKIMELISPTIASRIYDRACTF